MDDGAVLVAAVGAFAVFLLVLGAGREIVARQSDAATPSDDDEVDAAVVYRVDQLVVTGDR